MDRELLFNEPHISGGDALVTITEEKAIKFTKKSHPDKNMSDDDALKHFMVIYYAWYKDDKLLDRPF